jgi:tetratricopeptide (TPR) repeat protein
VPYLCELAGHCTRQGHYEEAAGLYREALTLTHDRAIQEERQLRLADCLVQLSQYDEARRLYQRLVASQREVIRQEALDALKKLTAAPKP